MVVYVTVYLALFVGLVTKTAKRLGVPIRVILAKALPSKLGGWRSHHHSPRLEE